MSAIRRDIDALERLGVLEKVYGGVQAASNDTLVSQLKDWNNRSEQNREEKMRITGRALDLIPDGATIALDIGTTTHMLAQQMGIRRDLTVLTSSMRAAGELCRLNAHRIYFIGGQLHNSEQISMGAYARSFLENFASIDIFVCSADGITLDAGATEYHEAVVDLKRHLTAIAKTTILVADHSKFGKKSMFKSIQLGDIDTIVTDSKLPEHYQDALQEAGVGSILLV
ncbi:MAG: DeoR/GlpR family DNA-binding transcription regulator [Planctomycetes bacterium]|nr:DeoR/GlpR family DNA-binding transcription regulator [Planctomycetota bacterium]